MFIYTWAYKTWDVATKHPGIVIGSLPAILIALGLIYHAAFFLPLDVPIFSLSLLTDFILPGLRQFFVVAAIVVITVLCVISVILLVIAFIALLLCHIISVLFSLLSRFLWMLGSAKILLFHIIRALVTWLSCRPSYYAHRIFRKSLDVLHLRNDFVDGVKQKAEHLQQAYFSAIDELSEHHKEQKEGLDTKLRSISECEARLLKCLSDNMNWTAINKKLSCSSRWLIAALLLSSGIVVAATAYKACYDRGLVENNGVVDFGNWKESSPLNKISVYKTPLEDIYEKVLSPMSKVQVRFRSGRQGPQNLLQVGGTSDFLLFWDDKQSTQVCPQPSADKNASVPDAKPEGEILIVPKSNILFIRPTDTNNMPADEDSCTHESKDIVEAIDKFNHSLTQKLTNLPAACTECPDIDYSGISSQLQEINSTFNEVKAVFKSRFQDDQ